MEESRNSSLTGRFSHIYIEEKAFDYPITKKVLDKFDTAVKIKIDHYKDVFCRTNQNFQLQKSAQKLILAVKSDRFLYKGPKVCQNFGNDNFYYAASLLNCIYNCDYCYLQGMYPSANIVAFVNTDDFFTATVKLLGENPVYLSVSYETDLPAFEGIIPYTSMWIDFAKEHPGVTIEVRTKNANFPAVSNPARTGNVILAWSLSPGIVIQKYEKSTPSLNARLLSIKQAVSNGWKVRLCFDPVIMTDNWQKIYSEFIWHIFSELPDRVVFDAGIGTFRMAGDYLKRIRKSRFDSDLIYYPFECRNGVAGYPEDIEKELIDFVYSQVIKYIDKERVFL